MRRLGDEEIFQTQSPYLLISYPLKLYFGDLFPIQIQHIEYGLRFGFGRQFG